MSITISSEKNISSVTELQECKNHSKIFFAEIGAENRHFSIPEINDLLATPVDKIISEDLLKTKDLLAISHIGKGFYGYIVSILNLL